jgi:hypothetical protein
MLGSEPWFELQVVYHDVGHRFAWHIRVLRLLPFIGLHKIGNIKFRVLLLEQYEGVYRRLEQSLVQWIYPTIPSHSIPISMRIIFQ